MPKRVLFIENDKALTESFQECIREQLPGLGHKVEIELVVARHMDEAIQLLGASKTGFDALIVDLMLPRNAEDLSELEELDRQRRELVRKHFRQVAHQRGGPDAEMVSLQKQIDVLDRMVERLVAPEGGCAILEQLARKRDPAAPPECEPRPLELPVIFFTARGLPEVKERCSKLVGERHQRFFEKPVMEADVLLALVELLGTSQE